MASNKNQPIILLHAGTTSTSIGSGTVPNDPAQSPLKFLVVLWLTFLKEHLLSHVRFLFFFFQLSFTSTLSKKIR